MTTEQPNLVVLAKQGNAKAIEALLNRSLQAKGIISKVAFNNGCLQVMLESSQIPNQQALVSFIKKGIKSLKSDIIKTVKVYSKLTDEDFPAWTEEFKLLENPSSLSDVVRNQSTEKETIHSSSVESNSNSRIKDNQPITDPKPSSISSQNLMTSQDKNDLSSFQQLKNSSPILRSLRAINKAFLSPSPNSSTDKNISYIKLGSTIIVAGLILFACFEMYKEHEYQQRLEALRQQEDAVCDAHEEAVQNYLKKAASAQELGSIYIAESGEEEKIEQLQLECSQAITEFGNLKK